MYSHSIGYRGAGEQGMSGWDSVAREGEDGREDGGCNSLQVYTGGPVSLQRDHNHTGGWDSLVREDGRDSVKREDGGCNYLPEHRGGWASLVRERDDDGWNYGRGCQARGRERERGGRYSRRGGRYLGLERGRGCSRRGGRGRGREDWGRRGRIPGRQSPVREDWGRKNSARAQENPGWGDLAQGWRNSGSPAPENSARAQEIPVLGDLAEGWGDLAQGWRNSGSPARENSARAQEIPVLGDLAEGWGDLAQGWGNSGSPAREDEGRRSEELETSGSESPTSENDDMSLSPENEDDKSAGRNRTERIQSLQSSVKSAFDDMQADLVRAERDNKELTETNKKLKEELKRAKEREESSIQNLEQTRSKLRELVERNRRLEEKEMELLKTTKEQEEFGKKLEEELKRAEKGKESSRQDLEQTRNKLRELCTTFAAVKEECDKVCDQQGVAPQVAKKRKYVLKVLEVNDLLNCSICLEPWTQSGEHTVCSLSCGHFFGKSCITQWILKDESRGYSTCPACLRRITLSDIRHHYVSQIYEA